MNRSRRYNQGKNFVPGGVYDGQQQQQKQYQQYQQNYQSNIQQPQPEEQQPQPQPQPQQQQQPQTPVRQMPTQQPQQQQPQQQEPTTAVEENDDAEMEQSAPAEDFINEKGKPLFKRIFGDRKKSSIRTREKKIRQNRRLRKAITPKNALMALNEVKGIQMSDFTVNSNPSGGFIAVVTINNSQYEGRGPSKAASKNNACEKALRDYVIAKMISKPRLSKATSENSVMMEDDTASNCTADTTNNPTVDEDDVPMVNLASFALFKLFSEWESEGFVIPEMHRSAAANGADANSAGGAAAAAQPKKPPPIRTELPDDWETMHPSTLLCMMRPGLTYQDLGTVGVKPNESQNVSVTVDGQEFKGSGRSKKLARRNAAVAVCNKLFGTNFVLEGLVAVS